MSDNVIDLATVMRLHPKIGEVVIKGTHLSKDKVRGLLIESMTKALACMEVGGAEPTETLVLVGVLSQRYVFDVLGVSKEPHDRL